MSRLDIYIEWLLFSANSAMFQLYHNEKKLIFNEIIMRSPLYKTNTLSGFYFMELAHWNNSMRIHMSPHADKLSGIRDNQSLLFHLNVACLAEKQLIPISYSLVWPDRWSNTRFIALEANTLTNDAVIYRYMTLDKSLSDWTVVYQMCSSNAAKRLTPQKHNYSIVVF